MGRAGIAICALRIEFVALVAGLLVFGTLASSATACAQLANRPYRVGVLHTAFFEEIPSVAGPKAGLKALGLEEGRDATFDIRFTRGKLDEAPRVAAALAKSGVDIIFAQTEQSARPLKEVTQTVPVVFAEAGNSVAVGLVASVPGPGGNITGISSLATELAPKRLKKSEGDVPRRAPRLGDLLRR